MKKYIFLLTAMFCVHTFANELQEWNKLFRCLDKHISSVARTVQSLEEGAKLLTQTNELCATEAYDLKNYLARNRKDNLGTEDFSARFQSYSEVV